MMHGPTNIRTTAVYDIGILLWQHVSVFFRPSLGQRTEVKGKAVPLQARMDPECSRKLRFPDFVTTAQDGDRLSALRTGRLYPQEMLLVLISVRG